MSPIELLYWVTGLATAALLCLVAAIGLSTKVAIVPQPDISVFDRSKK